MTKSATLDRFDRALLAAVQQDNLTPARVLAERVGLSESAVLRRLRRMRQEGVILADVSVVSPEVLGLPVTLHVLVSLERETSASLDAFVKTLRARSEVVAAWYVTGDADYLLQLRLPNMAAYEDFSRTVFQDEPNVRSFRTMVSMRQVVGEKTVQNLLLPTL
ncbi:Lrp/AsnC family transcriptional regulator [Methylobacterium sp. Leaf118]|uniref:Lrp/AsnC family transcriptional regulator n=1 Tax=Methylobacterium sp. Leaf118 TaxID=2876562 RepID=UPI001E2833CF|nr:Lrp/AsnC family transcriptional regulator [Methylobacterium sp. Leaf118]